MKVRVGLYILLILFLLISGKEEARAGRYAAKGDTCRVSDRMNQPETWSKIYQWVMDDPQVPDKEDVLMLIRYHFGNFEKLRSCCAIWMVADLTFIYRNISSGR